MGVSVKASLASTTSRSIDERSPAPYLTTPMLSLVLYPRIWSALATLVVPVLESPIPKIFELPVAMEIMPLSRGEKDDQHGHLSFQLPRTTGTVAFPRALIQACVNARISGGQLPNRRNT